MIVRKGEAKDMKAVLALIQELADFENEPQAVAITEADLIRDGFNEQPLFSVFVAETDSLNPLQPHKIVGIALYYYRYSTWKGKTIHLEDLVVNAAMRGKGIGHALYAEVIKQAQKDQVLRVEWNVLDWNKGAIAFYEKTGATVFREWNTVQMDAAAIQQFISHL
ncbi:GNAT family N-acetyltransferase [Flavobacterium crassostreae]|uniref:GNAT family acetyltransferase n=1 Tax=Flavobacterium crassostreae TaxID=1763534 RepID=A0A1B9E4F6_9FLAO|nr:GNAT family N-acetyltransferase [Flavobacterium crassostreae]OCB76840.1 GNAT family acetyltransferase [Flavobacterium crassostreae]